MLEARRELGFTEESPPKRSSRASSGTSSFNATRSPPRVLRQVDRADRTLPDQLFDSETGNEIAGPKLRRHEPPVITLPVR